MTKEQKAPVRPKRPNGKGRNTRIYSVRDIQVRTESHIDELARGLGLRRGQVIDQAVRAFWEKTFPEEAERLRVREPSECVSEDMAWLTRPQERLSAEEDPQIAELERSLNERRRRRDQIMGRAG